MSETNIELGFDHIKMVLKSWEQLGGTEGVMEMHRMVKTKQKATLTESEQGASVQP